MEKSLWRNKIEIILILQIAIFPTLGIQIFHYLLNLRTLFSIYNGELAK